MDYSDSDTNVFICDKCKREDECVFVISKEGGIDECDEEWMLCKWCAINHHKKEILDIKKIHWEFHHEGVDRSAEDISTDEE